MYPRPWVSILLAFTLVLHESPGFIKHQCRPLLLCLCISNALFNVEQNALLASLFLGVHMVLGLVILFARRIARKRRKGVLCPPRQLSLCRFFSEDSLVVGRQYLHESRESACEVKQDAGCKLGASVVVMILNQT